MHHVLNECLIDRGASPSMVSLEISVDGHHVTTAQVPFLSFVACRVCTATVTRLFPWRQYCGSVQNSYTCLPADVRLAGGSPGHPHHLVC